MKPRFDLPDVQFAEKSPTQIEADILARYKELTGQTLSPADPRFKFIQTFVLLASQQRSNIDYSAKQNLLGYATGNYLDHIGVRTETSRLQNEYATTTMRFHLSASFAQTVPANTRVTAGDNVFFEITENVVIPEGQMYADIEFRCTEPGSVGNGYPPGIISQLVDPLQWVQSVENLTESAGGADAEDDDSYALRIQRAPESFSVAGPTGAYEYWAMTTSQLIIDVLVDTSAPGIVDIFPLLQNGEIPSQEMLDAVFAVCNDKKVRPLTDKVQVKAPEQFTYEIDVVYWISTKKAALQTALQNKVNQALQSYILWQKSKLGRDIDPSELTTMLKNAGASRVAVTAPVYHPIERYQVAKEQSVSIRYGGLSND